MSVEVVFLGNGTRVLRFWRKEVVPGQSSGIDDTDSVTTTLSSGGPGQSLVNIVTINNGVIDSKFSVFLLFNCFVFCEN